LLVEGSHICCCLAARGNEFTRECLLCDLRQIAEAKKGHVTIISIPKQARRISKWGDSQEEHIEGDAEPRDSEVDPLDGIEGELVLALEEIGRGDERTREGGETLEALAGIEPHRSIARRAEDSDVGVGGDLETGEAAADNKGTAHEAAIFLVFSRGPEKDSTLGSGELGT
jgi:hypothetical protein